MPLSPQARSAIAGVALVLAAAGAAALTHHETGVSASREMDWLGRLAESGDAGAQLQLGLAYRDGRGGLTADAHKALHWLEAAARGGNAYAADAVANAYANGLGTAPDRQRAVGWWRAAAAGGNADAQRRLGETLLASGDDGQALRWLRAAADRGDAAAHKDLASLYGRNELSDADLHRGDNALAAAEERRGANGSRLALAAWHTVEQSSPAMQYADALMQRAEAGDPVAEYQLAMRYRDGSWGVARDAQEAELWLQRAAAAGNRVAVDTLRDAAGANVGAAVPAAPATHGGG